MTKKVYIIHGWEGKPSSNWFPWLKNELETRGYEVEVTQMPNTNNPKLTEWLSHFQKIANNPNEKTFFIGHSLGCISILRYLESLPENIKVGGAVLVAGFPDSIGYDELDSFTETPLNYDGIKKHADKFIVIQSDNDPYVSVKHGESLRDNLGAELIELKGRAHFNEFEIPEGLEALLKISE